MARSLGKEPAQDILPGLLKMERSPPVYSWLYLLPIALHPDFRQRVMTPGALVQPMEGIAEPVERDWSLSASFAAGAIDRIPTVKELIEGIVGGDNGGRNKYAYLDNRRYRFFSEQAI